MDPLNLSLRKFVLILFVIVFFPVMGAFMKDKSIPHVGNLIGFPVQVEKVSVFYDETVERPLYGFKVELMNPLICETSGEKVSELYYTLISGLPGVEVIFRAAVLPKEKIIISSLDGIQKIGERYYFKILFEKRE